MILGAGGTIGPTMARTAKRAIDQAQIPKKVIAVDIAVLPSLQAENIQTVVCDLLDLDAIGKLP